MARHLQGELDTKLHARSCREIRKHLADCPNCTAYLDSLKKTVFLYRHYPDPRLPKRTRQRLFAILRLGA
ncbi:MAG TPA: zf-HC2 domain-containing protein [Bacteroidota bacterium]|nr:zf-HC2 domain-containing protein [Bacteroidota bacterium]